MLPARGRTPTSSRSRWKQWPDRALQPVLLLPADLLDEVLRAVGVDGGDGRALRPGAPRRKRPGVEAADSPDIPAWVPGPERG